MIMHSEYYNMLITLCTCNSWEATCAPELTTLLWWVSFRRCNVSTIRAASTRDMKYDSHSSCVGTLHIDCTDTSQWRCCNCSCGTRDVEALTLYCIRIRTTSYHCLQHAHLFPRQSSCTSIALVTTSCSWLHHILSYTIWWWNVSQKQTSLEICCLAFSTYLLTRNHSLKRLVHEFLTTLYVCISWVAMINS